MPPDAFTFDTSGQLVMQTAIGGRRHAVRSAGRRGDLALPSGFPAGGARARRGVEAGARHRLRAAGLLPAPRHHRRPRGSLRLDLAASARNSPNRPGRRAEPAVHAVGDGQSRRRLESRATRSARAGDSDSGPILQATRPDQALRRPGRQQRHRFLRSTAANCAASSDPTAPASSTFFKMLTCEIPPTSGRIMFEGRDITGMNVTEVCQLGLTKSYQVNQLFAGLTVRENIVIAALAEWRGKFRLDMLRSLDSIPGLERTGGATLAAGRSRRAARRAGVRARLWREAAARDRPRAGDRAEPAAARRAAGRHEPAGAGRNRQAAQIDQPRAAP